jgi:hypothetical protein
VNITTIVQKLIALAVNNPNEEESKSAALKACTLIEQHQIPVGDNIVAKGQTIFNPDPDFMDMVSDIIKGANKSPDTEVEEKYHPDAPQSTPGEEKLALPEQELEDRKSAFQRQIVVAWRAIRQSRKSLDAEIQRYEKETGRRFTGEGRWM